MHGTHDLVRSTDDGRSAYSLCDTEVRKLRNSSARDEDVVRLDVSVDDSVLMCEAECRCDLSRNLNRFLVLDSAFFFDDLAERLAVHELHYDKVDVALLADIVNAHDIRVRKPRRCLRLSLEILYKLCVLRKFWAQNFDCYISIEKTASRLVNHGHSAFADFLD